ncbi:MAG: hypothetical protein JOZ83_15580 [Silvibacterium sp.]|nr:hypothetical protein [Silvibacterium sp.]
MAESPEAEELYSDFVSPANTRTWCRLAALFCGGGAANESVATSIHTEASPEFIWCRIAFYEEVPGRPPLLLDSLMCPLGTQGDKSEVGSTILCKYKQGSLVKRITALKVPCLIRFDVLNQQLGIEYCAIAQSGSYRIRRLPVGSEIVLTTNYRAFLHPRWFWRRLERLAVHQLHTHILNGIRETVAGENRSPATLPAARICREEET